MATFIQVKHFRLEGLQIQTSIGKAGSRKVSIEADEFGLGPVRTEIGSKDGILFTIKSSKLWVFVHSLARDQLRWPRLKEEEGDSRPL